ncbi:MAG: ACP phosphodiesterase [Flavobacteriales bacterium]|jgi:acyl carrier protein phosphodiesterase|nr:ACP phosphodiesterase [Flavobacteriales bacterium]
MNFLGHIFLSPNDDEILLGNFVADSVKGNPEKFYSGKIVDGIRFHRAIDEFTDNHQLVKQGVERFRKTQGRYAPVVIDVIYDHILASNWNEFHPEELNVLIQYVYQRLEAQNAHFPAQVKHYFPYMKAQNWLFNYQFEWGILKALEGLDRRSTNQTKMHLALDVYKESEAEFLAEFREFISDAQKMSSDYFSG